MSVKHGESVRQYVASVDGLRDIVQRMSLFLDSLPAPDDDGTLPSLHYGHLGSVAKIHALAKEAINMATECTLWPKEMP